jgi:hypothetical protein
MSLCAAFFDELVVFIWPMAILTPETKNWDE